MKTIIKNCIVFSLLVILGAMANPTDLFAQVDTSYMIEIDEQGDSTCFMLVGFDKIAMDCNTANALIGSNKPTLEPPVKDLANNQTELKELDPNEPISVDSLLNRWTYYTALMINGVAFVIGIINKFAPKFVLFKNDKTRDLVVKSLAGAAVIGWLLFNNGFVNSWQVGIAFVIAAFQYREVLKPLGLKTISSANKKRG